ncbi:hypothetical protein GOBAR_AA13504 [Gossypium barbadense]|uniref:Chlorophyll a-b binding protein, chloroplastic n=1 Tax=Gossypium barbadense TaxID=3634 RepID=A0A2P5XUW7_GOSBA|nr:hypothetical protein GOBAR_AA13504 [Gossypium barbadense]
MATQALVSSSLTYSVETARQILGAKRQIGPSRKGSFVVKAASTPPVKQGADRPLWFASKQSLSYLDGHRRFQDWAKPGSMGKQYFLGFEKYLGGSGEPAYPGGPLFNPLGFGKDEKSLKDLKLKEVKNGRLAMLAILGYFIQGLVTGVGPYQNLLDHLADPFNNNVLTNLKFH